MIMTVYLYRIAGDLTPDHLNYEPWSELQDVGLVFLAREVTGLFEDEATAGFVYDPDEMPEVGSVEDARSRWETRMSELRLDWTFDRMMGEP